MWEYLTVRFSGIWGLDKLTEDLDRYGKRGWNMVSAFWHSDTDVTCIFKRPTE
jgi:hypothetical protein